MTKPLLKNTGLINANEKVYEYFDSGAQGQLSIVFFNGFRMHLDSWEEIIPAVLDLGRVVLYNRLGVGKSSQASAKQTADVVVDDFRSFARAIHLRPPYVIVAHSLGGLFANYFARKYPTDVAGVLLVESPHPDEIVAQKQIKPAAFLSVINESLKFIEKKFNQYKYSEDDSVMESIAQVKGIDAFPAVPVTIISGVKKLPFVPQESFNVHLAFQKNLMELSPNATQVLAENSGHFPQVTQADLVIHQIRELVNRL